MAATGRRSAPVDETGHTYGDLTVLHRDTGRGPGAYWVCRCSCGVTTGVRGSSLRSGGTRSCGHASPTALVDETGHTYGELTVLYQDTSRRPRAHWVCRCLCGATTSVIGSDLRGGRSRFCGHARASAPVDETGNTYGELTVLHRDTSRGPKAYWVCRCSCGATTSVRGSSLRGGDTRSCGHLRS